MPPLIVYRQTTAGQQVTIVAGPVAELLARGPAARLVVSRSKPGRSDIVTTVEPGVHVCQAPLSWFASKPLPGSDGRGQKARDTAHVATQLCDISFGGEHGCPRNSGVAWAFQTQHDGAIHPCCNQNAARCRQPV